jgi:hypothetical protein
MSWPVAISGLLLFGGGDGPRSGKTPWLEDFAAAQKEAHRSGWLIFAVLH